MTRSSTALALALCASACASAPPIAPPRVIEPTFEQKMSWILRLEDQRILGDPVPPPAPQPPPAPVRGQRAPAATPTPVPLPPPDLTRLLADKEGRVRRRAALAIGRVGLTEGVPALVELLADPDAEVRQMAAFALGLIGDRSAREPLVARLADSSPLVRGSAAEALGLIGDDTAAPAIAKMASEVVASGALAELPPDEMDAGRDSPAAAFRLALYALVRLKAFDALSSVVLDSGGQPRVRWWPVAYALQRLENPRALAALLTLANDPQPYTRAFAAKGLGAMNSPAAAAPLRELVSGPDDAAAVEAIRGLGRLKDASAAPGLVRLLQSPMVEPHRRLEIVTALGLIGGTGISDALIDLLGDPNPSIRAAVLRSLSQIDAEGFVFILSGLDADADWSVRAALASVLATLKPETGLPRLRAMLLDPEPRVIPPVLTAIARLRPPDAAQIMIARLTDADPIIRSAAATALSELKPQDGVALLTEAYHRGQSDTTYVARASALAALATYGSAATPLLNEALADKDWAVRLRAAQLLKQFDPVSDAALRIRPAPATHPERYTDPRVINPPYSAQATIETERGTIQVELAVLDAPETVQNFMTLARAGFFDNVTIHRVVPDFVIQGGDPRGDGEGGPGYSIRDELNERAYLRGAVGMALDWADTGGSQFFITHSPQPHLDAKYTIFGRVLAGMDVVDRIQQWDVIRRVTIWDGTTPGTP